MDTSVCDGPTRFQHCEWSLSFDMPASSCDPAGIICLFHQLPFRLLRSQPWGITLLHIFLQTRIVMFMVTHSLNSPPLLLLFTHCFISLYRHALLCPWLHTLLIPLLLFTVSASSHLLHIFLRAFIVMTIAASL